MSKKYKNNDKKEFYTDDSVVPEDEVWVDIKVAPNYKVSSYGRVKNKTTGLFIKPFVSNRGYLRVNLSSPVNKKYTLHRLVGEYFISKDNDGLIINHIDGNKQNNHVSNLEWITHQENVKHAINNNLRSVGSEVTILDLKTNKVIEFKTLHRATTELGIPGDTFLLYKKKSEYSPIFGRYVVKTLKYNGLTKPKTDVQIHVYDYLTGSWDTYNNINIFMLETGIAKTTIDPKKSKVNCRYIAGYYVCVNADKPTEIPEVSKEQAKSDRVAYYSKPYKKATPKYYVYDYETGKEHYVKSIDDIAKLTKRPRDKVSRDMKYSRSRNTICVINGFGIQSDADDKIDWNTVANKNIVTSILGLRSKITIFINAEGKLYHDPRDVIRDYDVDKKYHNHSLTEGSRLIKKIIDHYGLDLRPLRATDTVIGIWKHRK